MENTENPSLHDVGERFRGDLRMLRDVADQRTQDLLAGVRGFVEERPLTSLAAAFGIGFALSGGLVSKPTMRVIGLATRLYLRRYLTAVLGSAAAELLGGAAGNGGTATSRT